MSHKRGSEHTRSAGRHTSAGFSLIEALIAIVVLAFGILGLASVMGDAIASMHKSQDDYIAQQKAEEAVEAVFFARDSKLYTWSQIKNSADGGIFLNGPQPLLHAGVNGIIGTVDDQVANPDVIILPGPDGILGTADDIKMALTNFTRQIVITDVAGEPNVRQIQITVQYSSGRLQGKYVLNSYISAFS